MDNFAYGQNFGYMMPPQQQQVVRVNGGDAKKAFYDMAKQKGVDPNAILSMLR